MTAKLQLVTFSKIVVYFVFNCVKYFFEREADQ